MFEQLLGRGDQRGGQAHDRLHPSPVPLCAGPEAWMATNSISLGDRLLERGELQDVEDRRLQGDGGCLDAGIAMSIRGRTGVAAMTPAPGRAIPAAASGRWTAIMVYLTFSLLG